jgi:hypothetical protein
LFAEMREREREREREIASRVFLCAHVYNSEESF